MLTMIRGWLEAKLRWIELGVFAVAILVSVWATHRIDGLLQTEKVVTVLQTQIKEVQSVKVIHDKVASMPSGAAAIELRKNWTE